MTHNLKPYPTYKPSGVKWLGDVPAHWRQLPGRACFSEKKIPNTGMKEATVLSLSYGQIVVKPAEKLHGLVPASFETYQVIEPGDIVVRPTDLQNDWNSLRFGLSHHRGIITSAYMCLNSDGVMSRDYGYLLLHTYDLKKVFYGLGSGLRQNLNWSDFKYLPCLVPPLPEQHRIATFLDQKTTEIDEAINKKQRLIDLLKEQKAILINQAVTKGLNPNVPMRDSGVEWIGEVPAHWGMKRVKQVSHILRGKFTHRPRNDPTLYDGPYPFIQTGEVARAEKTITSYRQTLNERGFAVSKMFPAGTLVMTIAANIGDVAVLNFPACFPDSIVGFMPRSGVERDYLYYAFLAMRPDLLREAPVNTQGNLNIDRVGSRETPLPPVAEQRAIVQKIEERTLSMNIVTARARHQIDLLQEYRTILIANVVTGKLDVREDASRES